MGASEAELPATEHVDDEAGDQLVVLVAGEHLKRPSYELESTVFSSNLRPTV